MGLGLPGGWGDRLRAQIDSGDIEEMLLAAENVTRLDGPAGGEYGRWLEQSVGSLRATSSEVIQAIAALGAPIATTNYDNLIEDVTGLPRVTWQQEAEAERVMRRDGPGVLHLPGHWRDPASVVLGIRSYERVLGDEHAQGMQTDHESLAGFLRALAPAKPSQTIAPPPTSTEQPPGGPSLVIPGRPAAELSPQQGKSQLLDAVDSDRDLYVAMDLGGTKAYVSLMDGEADRLFDQRFLTRSHEDPDRLLGFIEECIKDTIDEIDKRYAIDPQQVWTRVRAIGIAFPGPTDHEKGLILDAPNFHIKDFSLADKVRESCHDIPTFVDNDVNLGVLGEAWKRATRLLRGARQQAGHGESAAQEKVEPRDRERQVA